MTHPPPLVPADVDLTDFAFMPLDVRRLRDSRFTATIGPDAFKVGLLLWCASWHQVPAASLPDDDVELAQLAGFGRVVREWKKVRAAALYGWVACSDGRLYHPTVAEKALESWESKLRHAHGKMSDRLRKVNKARELAKLPPLIVPSFEAWNSGGRRDPVPPEERVTSGGIPAEKSLKGQGTEGTGKGEEEKEKKELAPRPSVAPPPPARSSPPAFDGNNFESLNGKSVVGIAAAWELPEAWGVDAEALGWKPYEVLHEAEKFRQYWTTGNGAGKRRAVKGWKQAWSNWLGKAAERKR